MKYVKGANALYLGADSHALTAEDAHTGVANKEGVAGVNGLRPFQLPKALLVDADISSDFL
jgi:hypothetical protein